MTIPTLANCLVPPPLNSLHPQTQPKPKASATDHPRLGWKTSSSSSSSSSARSWMSSTSSSAATDYSQREAENETETECEPTEGTVATAMAYSNSSDDDDDDESQEGAAAFDNVLGSSLADLSLGGNTKGADNVGSSHTTDDCSGVFLQQSAAAAASGPSGSLMPVITCAEPGESSLDGEFPPPSVLLPEPPCDDNSDATNCNSRNRSILRRMSCPADFTYLNPKSSCWRSLPPPDLLSLSSSCALARRLRAERENMRGADASASLRPRSVSFGHVHWRSYSQTVGDNPSVSYGPPISLDWDYLELPPVEIDIYEENKCGRAPRTPRQLLLNYYQRHHVLGWKLGVSPAELKKAERDANRGKRQRAVTRALLPLAPLEEAFQRATRTTTRQRRRASSISSSTRAPNVTFGAAGALD